MNTSNVPALDIVTHSCLLSKGSLCICPAALANPCSCHPDLRLHPSGIALMIPVCLSVEPDCSRLWPIRHNWVKCRLWCWDALPCPASCLSTAQQEWSEYGHRFTKTHVLWNLRFIYLKDFNCCSAKYYDIDMNSGHDNTKKKFKLYTYIISNTFCFLCFIYSKALL